MEEGSICFSIIDLPKHLWEFMIFPKLGLKDLTQCRAVCHSWKCMVAENPGYHHRLPCLSENKIYNIKFTRLVTEAFCNASSQGYLIMANGDEDTNVGNQLHPEEQLEEDRWLFHDLLFYKGMLYGLTRANILVSFEFVDSSKPLGYRALNMLPMNTHTPEEDTVYTNYLVESFGELLMVYRCRNIINDGIRVTHSTKKLLVFKLDQSSDLLKWVQVQSLGDQMLFLGQNSSVSVSATGIPGFKGSCIYFTDDNWLYFWLGYGSQPSCSDNGVFYLNDGRIESIFTPDDSHPMKSLPVSVTPRTIFHE
ncbi:hypothetical protein AQUCO_00201052v1 [Aquilegia coerulea]|uniref:KIB1-4 beta-propeller domain-containing protein n=1 Tax=Aquilegia coerulea TaxID=218851 RepID=A0A2G5F605_AQUCA|nr:hypothetical protein AQUCO_00201052v1 [Aquilegia coerulea]